MSTYTPQQRVLLLELSERTSAKGNAYMSGWLGKASVVAFKAEHADKHGNPVWQVFVTEPQQREEQRQQPAPPSAGAVVAKPSALRPLPARPVGAQGDGWKGSAYRRPANGPQRAPTGQDGAFEDAGPLDFVRAG
jgi:hypothetical protein